MTQPVPLSAILARVDAPAHPTVAEVKAMEQAKNEAAEAAFKVLAEKDQLLKGRRRADAMLAGLRAVIDSGRDPLKDLDGDDANCIWGAASLFNRIAGRPDPGMPAAEPRSAPAAASPPAARVLSPEVERAAAEPVALADEDDVGAREA